ncbi:hypothetical protein I3J27_18370 [Bradyrhizobium xenonodulans]|uniref:Uncharacterized protein n=1 Tax=Bradyrhizobium xenonodulans TaxID=2736875 RepID=A0ABY7MV58_9BRAD|nr:hypothetical protein [Bradyrhizobium xenonodulans]WBL82298.1 hypothetical protein I3J27_18370 [Bradyrhizobium xenonodulans]
MRLACRLILAFALMAGLAPAFAQVPPPVPALPDTERRTSYSITASTCACNVGFALYGDSTDYANWIEVWVNGALIPQSGNWTITSPTGSLATIPRPISDAVLTFTQVQTGTVQIVGARRPRRTSQFSESRGVAARDLNQVLTDLTAQNRETWDKINDVTGRIPRVPPGETLATLPVLAARANQGACFNSGGNLTSCVSVPNSTFVAGNGIAFTGTNPTTISNNIVGSGPIQVTGTNPLNIGCPSCSTMLTNVRLAQIANYSASANDCGSTLALGGGTLFTLTLTAASGYSSTCAFLVVNEDTSRGKKLAISGYSNFILWPLQTAIIYAQNNAWQLLPPGRWKLPGSQTMHVDPLNGNDANDGLATGSGAFQTLTAAWTTICTSTDLAGQAVTLQLADGLYSSGLNSTLGPMNAPYLGVTINGNATTPDNVLLSTGASDSFRWFETGSPISVWIKNLKMTTTGGDAIRVLGAGNYVRVSNVNFGAVGSGVHMRAFNAAEIDAFNDSYKITGGASAHYNVNGLGIVGVQNQTINISGNPTFASAFGLADGGQILVQGDTYSVTGTVTGTRYIARNLGLIDTAGGGASYFPGTIAGATATGGQYN